MKLPVYFITGLLLSIAVSVKLPEKPLLKNQQLLAYIKNEAALFATKAMTLQTSLENISSDSSSIIRARTALKICRLQYKKISFFLEYFYPSEAQVYNGPPKYEVEEPYMEYQEPKGLQVIEGLLYEKNPDKPALIEQAHLITSSATDIPSLFYRFSATDAQLMESIRLEFIRIMTLYITGYDAPLLKSGVEEAEQALDVIRIILNPYIENKEGDSIRYYLAGARDYVNRNSAFDSFDRLHFLTAYALPLQTSLNIFCKQNDIFLTTANTLNPTATDLFKPNAFNKNAFSNVYDDTSEALINLGKTLFFDKTLSGNNSRSCASCHSPVNYFTDGISRNKTFNGQTQLTRNTPTLLYSIYQYSQFWDGRAASLEAQVHDVMNNKQEMNASDTVICNKLMQNKRYQEQFNQLWHKADNAITINQVSIALSAYVRNLTPFLSPFDKYMEGDSNALSKAQQNGFNIFMGKAQCGTCHFAPLFNGLTPPLYNKTEYEILGTTSDDNFSHPVPDTDKGRYNFFPIRFYKGAFKTPTVRNAAVTAPYMHNGKFKSLKTLIDFYDKGGGAGMGLKITNQTLSQIPLHLTDKEKEDLISFIGSLTDKHAF